MKIHVAVILLALSFQVSEAKADYDPPTFEQVAARSTAIVDATVLGIATREVPLEVGTFERAEASLKIHRQLIGTKKAPTILTGIALACESRRFDGALQPKTRYILCLVDDQLFEAHTCYKVREIDGKAECLYQDARSAEKMWMHVSELEDKLRAARAAGVPNQQREAAVPTTGQSQKVPEAVRTAGALSIADSVKVANAVPIEEIVHVADAVAVDKPLGSTFAIPESSAKEIARVNLIVNGSFEPCPTLLSSDSRVSHC